MLIFITDPELQDEFNEVYQSYFRTHQPPRTFVTVPALVHKDMLVEIEVTAALPADDRAARRVAAKGKPGRSPSASRRRRR